MKTSKYYDCTKTHCKGKMAKNALNPSVNRYITDTHPASNSAYLWASKALLTGSVLLRRAFTAMLILMHNALRWAHREQALRQRLTIFSCFLLLSACGLNTPEPAPPPGQQAIEITRQQSLSLDRIDTFSVIVRGSPDDADREVKRQANQRGAQYYRIVSRTESEKRNPGTWRAFAVLYHQPTVPKN